MLPNKPGVYIIHCRNKSYVGSAARSIQRRVHVHMSKLRAGTSQRKMQAAWDKYGERAFTCEVLELVDDSSQLIRREQHWMNKLRPWFNVMPFAGSSRGCKQTRESVAKRAAAIRGKPRPDMRGNKWVEGKRWKLTQPRRNSID